MTTTETKPNGMTFHPLEDRLYVQMDERLNKVGSIILSDNHSERTRTGVVAAVGPDVKTLKAGDKIIISYYTGQSLHLPQFIGKEELHRIVREGEVLAVIEE